MSEVAESVEGKEENDKKDNSFDFQQLDWDYKVPNPEKLDEKPIPDEWKLPPMEEKYKKN